MKHHPLRSSLDFNNVGCDNNDSDGENSDISEMFLAQEPLKCVDDYDMNPINFSMNMKTHKDNKVQQYQSCKSNLII